MSRGIYKRTDEHKKKMSEINKGKKGYWKGKQLSEKHKQAIKDGMNRKEVKEKIYKANKGKHHTEESKRKMSDAHKGRIFSEEHKRKLSESLTGKKKSEEHKKELSESLRGNIPWIKGKSHSEETKNKISETLKSRPLSEETKKKISEANKGKPSNRKGCYHSEETKRKMSKDRKGKNNPMYGKTGEKAPWFGKHLSEEHRRKIGEAQLGKLNHNWNPNREEVYAPYGENFYDEELKNEKWKLQNGRDMLTGTKLDPNKRLAYHHIDYNKSNDDPDNHCFLSINNHARITGYQSNPIKSERYKRKLQENALTLKNGQIPKYWSQINKELFRQEKLKQFDLSLYII